MLHDLANTHNLSHWLKQVMPAWEKLLRFEDDDCVTRIDDWQSQLQTELPSKGYGMEQTVELLSQYIIPNGSVVPDPGFTAWITTGAVNSALLARWSADIASPQRISMTAFHLLEDVALKWLKSLFGLPQSMQGVFTSGGASANLIGLGAARQAAYEALGYDAAETGIPQPGCIFASASTHKTIHRSAAILGLGRQSVIEIETDSLGKMDVDKLRFAIEQEYKLGTNVPIAVVANAGATSTGAIDPIGDIANICEKHDLWLHVDGAYGLPGLLDDRYRDQYQGLERADSVIVDPHKWLGAPVGIGAVFVKSAELLFRGFRQGTSDYLEGVFSNNQCVHSMDQAGIPYADFGIDLSAPARGVVVWAMLTEIGAEGLKARICRHNSMALWLAEQVKSHNKLELLANVSLSICCFRYRSDQIKDLNTFNQQLLRRVIHKGDNIPSSATINGKFSIRPCFIGARTTQQQAEDLLQDVLLIGKALEKEWLQK